MKNNRISFIGMANINSARNMQPGHCFRAVNLRNRNGSLIPVGNYPVFAALTDNNRSICFVHLCNEIQHIISAYGNTIYHDIDLHDMVPTPINRELLTLDDKLSDIRAIGNTLILVTGTSIYYLLYGDNGYKVLGQQPPLPMIRFLSETQSTYGALIPELAMHGEFTSLSDDNYVTFYNHLMSQYYRMRDDIYNDKLFLQPVMIRYALRLYDGSHILPSPPIIIGNINKSAYNEAKTTLFSYRTTNDETIFQAFPMYFDAYSIHYIIDTCLLDDWKDIIMGIDIFVSKEIPMLTDDASNTSHSTNNGNGSYTLTFQLPTLNDKELYDCVDNESLYYHLYTIDINSITTNNKQKITHDIHPNDLIYRNTLTVDTGNFNRLGARQAYVYNNRLHLADITYHYYEGYPATLFSHSINTGNSNAIVYTRTTIKHNNGEIDDVIAHTNIPAFNYKLSPILSYPDIKATSMEIVIRHNGYEYRQTFALKSCATENRASYIHFGIEDIDVTTWQKQEITDENLSDFISTSSSISIEQHNRLIVSRVNNPFLFPAEQSYNVSDDTIIGIAAATTALSQGQYGEFPLYVFTGSGIWSMQQGNELQCYSHCIPINNEHIDNRLPVTPIEHAVIYRSGNNICTISGAQSNVILSLDETAQDDFSYILPSVMSDGSEAHTDNETLEDFFVKETRIGYNYPQHEMIFYNNNHNYCMVLHIPSGHLYRLDKKYTHILAAQGSLIAQGNDNALYNLYNEIDAYSLISLITNPIQLVPDGYTRLRQLMWRMKGNYVRIESIITASHEPDGCNKTTHRLYYNGYIAGHLPVKHLSPPYKYFRFMLYGVVTHDFRLDCADIAYIPVENNKLR